MPQYEYDKFGYCIMCSKHLIAKEYIGKEEVMRFLPDHSQETVLLSDNSKMDIIVCKQCKSSIENNLDTIMTKVYKGWEHSIVELDGTSQEWSIEKKNKYFDRYSKLTIQGTSK